LPSRLARSDESDQDERKNDEKGKPDVQKAAPKKESFTAVLHASLRHHKP
jgi:hypothetical protein